MAPPRKSVRLARELAEAPVGKLQGRFVKPFVLLRLCELASEKISCGDHDGLRLARLCCRISQQLKTAEARALSFGRLATALRVADRLDHAESALAIAMEFAPDSLLGDLLRRRVWIRIYQGRFEEAVEDAEEALQRTSGSAKAKAHEALGIAHLYSGNRQAGLCQLKQCLATTDPDAETAYCNALHNYATALAEGTDEEAAEALKLCTELRGQLKDRHRLQRAKLWWTIGLLHLRLDAHLEAWRALDIAYRSLIALQAAPEVAAIIADMARVDPQPLAIRHACREASAVIREPHPLAEPLADLADAEPATIPVASAALREAAGQITPCPPL